MKCIYCGKNVSNNKNCMLEISKDALVYHFYCNITCKIKEDNERIAKLNSICNEILSNKHA